MRPAGPGWFHGGLPGREPGEWLLPPVVTGVETGTQAYQRVFGVHPADDHTHLEPDRADPNFVFVCTDLNLAIAHAGRTWLEGRADFGAVYEVWPLFPEDDPDHVGLQAQPWAAAAGVGEVKQAQYAIVTRVVDPAARPSGEFITRHFLRYKTNYDGSPRQRWQEDANSRAAAVELLNRQKGINW